MKYAVDAIERRLQDLATPIETASSPGEIRYRRLAYELERAKQQALADKAIHDRENAQLAHWKKLATNDHRAAGNDPRLLIGAERSRDAYNNQKRVFDQALSRWSVSGARVERLRAEMEAVQGAP